MTADIIDSVIAEASVPETALPDKENSVETSADDELDGPAENDGLDENQADESVPKRSKVARAVERRERTIGKLRAEIAARDAELQRFRQTAQQNPVNQSNNADSGPNEADFDNYGDYLEAKVLFKVKQEQAAQMRAQQDQHKTQQEQAWAAEREQAIIQLGNSHKETIPDFTQVVELNADIADTFPPHVERAFLEADDAALAFYNLAKEGKLEELATMSPYKAAMTIAIAQTKKPTLNKVSNAPAPIRSVKGTGSGAKSLDNMSWSEMKTFLKT